MPTDDRRQVDRLVDDVRALRSAVQEERRRSRVTTVAVALCTLLVVGLALPWTVDPEGRRTVSGWRLATAATGDGQEALFLAVTIAVAGAIATALVAVLEETRPVAVAAAGTAAAASVLTGVVWVQTFSPDSLATVGAGLGTVLAVLPLLAASSLALGD